MTVSKVVGVQGVRMRAGEQRVQAHALLPNPQSLNPAFSLGLLVRLLVLDPRLPLEVAVGQLL